MRLTGERAAVRVWSPSELARQTQPAFYYNYTQSHATGAGSDQLLFFSPAGNPALVHSAGIECMVKTRGYWGAEAITVTGVTDVVVEDLAVQFANSGMRIGGATGATRIIVRRLDISWIGGGCLVPGPRWPRNPLECTRSGNGIEISEFEKYDDKTPVDSRIELYGNRLWEVYDAAMSPQGSSFYVQSEIRVHHNLVSHSEYCFEIWSQGLANESILHNVSFVSNTCYNSGGGWSHAVRPDPSGRGICSFTNSGNTSNIWIVSRTIIVGI